MSISLDAAGTLNVAGNADQVVAFVAREVNAIS